MSKYDWGIIFTLGGCLALAGVALWDHQQQQKSDTYCEATESGIVCRPHQFLSERAGIPRWLERVISNPEPRTGEDHEIRDLAAQEASAVWALWMVVISAIGTFIAIVGTFMLYLQLKITRGAVQEAGQANAALIRMEDARVSISIPMIKPANEQHKFIIYFTIANIGRTSAIIHKIRLNSQEIQINEPIVPATEPLRKFSLPESLVCDNDSDYIDIIIEYSSLLMDRINFIARAIVVDYPDGENKFGSIVSEHAEPIAGRARINEA